MKIIKQERLLSQIVSWIQFTLLVQIQSYIRDMQLVKVKDSIFNFWFKNKLVIFDSLNVYHRSIYIAYVNYLEGVKFQGS